MFAEDYRRIARERLKGKWGIAILVGFIASILGGSIDVGYGRPSLEVNEGLVGRLNLSSAEVALILSVISVLVSILTVLGVISLIIGGAVKLGYASFNLDIVDGRPTNARVLFSQFNRLKEGFVMHFMSGLFIMLWSLFLVIPGIMKAYSYAMAPYILAENPQMTGMEAITASKNMMYGHRWDLFCLMFSFIGWDILSLFTLGILQFWIHPYREAAMAAFYRDLKGQSREYYVS